MIISLLPGGHLKLQDKQTDRLRQTTWQRNLCNRRIWFSRVPSRSKGTQPKTYISQPHKQTIRREWRAPQTLTRRKRQTPYVLGLCNETKCCGKLR
ncbi:hypothetical protein PoB_002252600 [Plakobranchus ocellatus]|uniref:Uncharacterized protein n=1 Tax=Plakobranchus ocellatus TaxID=259542 RepID=A0AAV3Z9Q1_9GAST|nr:hypothetical protein PoB_002252600 [Plakobranchus ocellatus]